MSVWFSTFEIPLRPDESVRTECHESRTCPRILNAATNSPAVADDVQFYQKIDSNYHQRLARQLSLERVTVHTLLRPLTRGAWIGMATYGAVPARIVIPSRTVRCVLTCGCCVQFGGRGFCCSSPPRARNER